MQTQRNEKSEYSANVRGVLVCQTQPRTSQHVGCTHNANRQTLATKRGGKVCACQL